MGKIIIIIVIIVLIAIVIFILRSGKNKNSNMTSTHSRSRNTSNTEKTTNTIPAWLEQELQAFQEEALSYELYRLSLDGELSSMAKTRLEELNIKVITRPSLLLFGARKKAECTSSQLNKYLECFYEKQTGQREEKKTDWEYTIQELFLAKAKSLAKLLQHGE